MDMEFTREELRTRVSKLGWYHTIELPYGITTNGEYDHRKYLDFYDIPEDLSGKSVLDVGAASGFFSFEFERRGGNVTATDITDWAQLDLGPNYKTHHSKSSLNEFLTEPFKLAKKALQSKVEKKSVSSYDLSPETIGTHDIVFCGSVLLHLMNPIKALIGIRNVTKEYAIIATAIAPSANSEPIALMKGFMTGDVWWIPTKECLQLMAISAGFAGVEWISDFHLNYRDGRPGPYHGVLRAYSSAKNCSSSTISAEDLIARQNSCVGSSL